MEISIPMKYKALSALSDGPKTSSQLFDLFKSRGPEYRVELEKWLDGKVAAKYRIPQNGRPATVYSIEPAGVDELERLKAMIV